MRRTHQHLGIRRRNHNARTRVHGTAHDIDSLRHRDGIDIDPQAVLSTAENARINRVEVTALGGDAPLPPPADLVIANILSTPLKLLAPILSSLVAPGGRLVLSGVLERQIDEVASCYDPALNVQAWRTRDGWACLSGRR